MRDSSNMSASVLKSGKAGQVQGLSRAESAAIESYVSRYGTGEDTDAEEDEINFDKLNASEQIDLYSKT